MSAMFRARKWSILAAVTPEQVEALAELLQKRCVAAIL